ncbi:MAG: type II toxin-antitoxin system RelE/ParE family toxin [Alphaproteobacteria bacterium]|nr:type II toxin-antitoxin system RelE/ParE family toxin [Alphaproteobacteria bacterium]
MSSEAAKVLKRADRPTQERLSQKIDALAEDPFAASKPLVNSDMRSARVGGLRMLLKLDHGEVVVLVISIEARGQVYRRLS